MREVVIARLRDLLGYLERTPEPDWRQTGVELEALAKSLYRLSSGVPAPPSDEPVGGHG